MITQTRQTKETDITIDLQKSQNPKVSLEIGVPYFEHLLTALLVYGKLEATIKAVGDLEIDPHHTLEDVGIVLGMSIRELYRSQSGFQRFACAYVPMDEALVRVALDISGRPYFVIEGLELASLSSLDQCLLEFLRSMTIQACLTVHIDMIRGFNRHHIFEAIFKAYGKALADALVEQDHILSTKGVIS